MYILPKILICDSFIAHLYYYNFIFLEANVWVFIHSEYPFAIQELCHLNDLTVLKDFVYAISCTGRGRVCFV
jgi:hypothetical protein